LYEWSEQQTAEQVADSLVLRWFCRLGMQPAPSAKSVRQGLDQVSVEDLEALASRVEHTTERAKTSEGRLRPMYRQRWR
jgi:transposase, IS5 family